MIQKRRHVMNQRHSENNLFSKMIKMKEKAYFFDIKNGKKGKKILKIMKSQAGNCQTGNLTLMDEEFDLFLKTLQELQPILHEK